jgi:hypothetical protein
LRQWEGKKSPYPVDLIMAEQIYLLFSSDYELYFGENYLSEREVLIEPTEHILRAFEEEGIPMTLFADVASVWRYYSLKVKSDYILLFEEQLRQAIRQGHDVQLHLHPHWMTSKFDGKRWEMDESKFKLSDLGYGGRKTQSLESADELIIRGKEYLEKLLRPVDPSYQCIAFRAGGYGIQPNDKELIGALLSAGFKIDSSIVPGMFFKSNVNQIDFRRVPSKLNYRIGTRYGIDQEDSQGIFEIPIAAYSESFQETMMDHFRMLRIFGSRFVDKIVGVKNQVAPRGKTIQKNSPIKQVVSLILRPSLFSLEFKGQLVDVKRMLVGTNKLIRSHLKESTHLYLSPTCHPKNVFLPTIQGIREFWRSMVHFYGKNIKAITFQEAAKKMEV